VVVVVVGCWGRRREGGEVEGEIYVGLTLWISVVVEKDSSGHPYGSLRFPYEFSRVPLWILFDFQKTS